MIVPKQKGGWKYEDRQKIFYGIYADIYPYGFDVFLHDDSPVERGLSAPG